MVEEFDSKNAVEILGKITGPEGLLKLSQELSQEEAKAKQQISVLTGKVQSLRAFQLMLQRFAVSMGIDTVEVDSVSKSERDGIKKDVEGEDERSATASKLDDELAERIEKGLCMHKDPKTKKWCRRKLKTKAEKESSYCKIHMKALGMIEDATE